METQKKYIIDSFQRHGIFHLESTKVLPNSEILYEGRFKGKGKKYSFLIDDHKTDILLPLAVHISETNSIGVIIDIGKDSAGTWYRTDADGVRDPEELLFLHSKTDVEKCIKQLKANIAPSTKKSLNL